MKHMQVLLISVLFIGICAVAHLWYVNRASDAISEKLLPALVIGLFGSFFTLWFSLKEDTFTSTFRVDIMTHDDAKQDALEKHDKKYDWFYGSKRFQIRRYAEYNSDTYRRYMNAGDSYARTSIYPYDILFIETLTICFSSCTQEDSGLEFSTLWPSGNVPSRLFPENKLVGINLDRQVYDKLPSETREVYSQLVEKTILDSFALNQAIVPEGTRIEIECDQVRRCIHLSNRFCTVNIEILRFGGYRGLGEWQWILGYDRKTNNEFFTSQMGIKVEARFRKLRAGHPDMPKYKLWVNGIIDRLRDCLDSEQHLKQARERYLLFENKIETHLKDLESAQTDSIKKRDTEINDPNDDTANRRN